MKLSAGESVGRYHILEPLGEGGMAAVYKAYDTRLEREVAIKFLRTELFGSAILEQLYKRFEREAKALARLSNFHIVKIYDFGEHEGVPYLVMEYIPGGTLKEKMGKSMSWQQALSQLLPVANALEYAHQRGVLHRDVKPSNILINESGEPMLSDFGIAKILESSESQAITSTGVGIGTPEYMAPEQGLGQDVDARTDVYSLGVVLYEMLTGRKPYTADTPTAVLIKHIHDPLPSPRAFVPDLPESIERLVFKALAKQPENRYISMAEFSRAMEGLLKPTLSAPQEVEPAEVTLAVEWRPKSEALPSTKIYEQAGDTASPPHLEPAKSPPIEKLPRIGQKEEIRRRTRPIWVVPLIGVVLIAVIALIAVFVFPAIFPGSEARPGSQQGYLLFTSDRDGREELYRMSASGEITRLTTTPDNGSSNSITLNPDGSVFFVSTQAGGKEIYRLAQDGEVSRVTNSGVGGESLDPVYDPNSYLLFSSNRAGKFEIYRLDAEGNITKVTNTPNEYESREPAIDPAGNIVFVSNREDGKWEIYRMGEDGAINRLTHTEGKFESFSPVADPASYLIFVSDRSGKRELYRMDEAGKVFQVTNTPRSWESWDPFVDRQGNIVFTSNRSGVAEIYRIEREGSITQITRSPEGSASWGAVIEP